MCVFQNNETESDYRFTHRLVMFSNILQWNLKLFVAASFISGYKLFLNIDYSLTSVISSMTSIAVLHPIENEAMMKN